MAISVNNNAFKIVEEMIENSQTLSVEVVKLKNGSTIVDCGIKVAGGHLAGLLLSKACLGNLANVTLTSMDFEGYNLPAINVATDHPAIACLGSQFAGWRIKVGKFFAMGSGPARALSLVEKELFEKINYRDDADKAIITLETRDLPNEEVMQFIADRCDVDPKNTYAIVAPTASIAGSIQIAARIVETGIHKITELGFDPKKIKYGFGISPIAPIAKNDLRAMGLTNDMIIAAGCVTLNVISSEDDDLGELIKNTPSSTSKDYGKPFYEIFKAAGKDFYKIDPTLFAPAVMNLNDLRIGKNYLAGKIDKELVERSLSLLKI